MCTASSIAHTNVWIETGERKGECWLAVRYGSRPQEGNPVREMSPGVAQRRVNS
jgi:hypothetical protein